MDFDYNARTKDLVRQVAAFMEEHVYPNEEQMQR